MKIKQLVHDSATAVDEMLEGMVTAHKHLVLVKEERVLLHRDFKTIRERQVTLLSGGGSGHEPAHAGYIGEGMLTGAICGGIFASPSTGQVLAAIRLAAGPAGCLVIIKNYTGDRINFGLAVEQAKAEGLKVDMVIVGEDVAVDTNAGRRGLSGTVLIHKLAGAAAKKGQSLASIVDLVNSITSAGNIGTMGVALNPCTLPGQKEQSHGLRENEMEIGMGIHGEPGISKIQITKVPILVENLIEHLTRSKGLAPLFASSSSGSRVVLMVNNLGATTSIEIYVVTKYAIQQLEKKGIKVVRTLVGSFMTALNMTGFSLSLWHPTSDAQLELFDSPTNAQGWNYYVFKPVVATNTELFVTPSPAAKAQKLYTRPDKLTPTGIVIEKSIEAACKALIEAEPDLTRWDSKVGDGDCGITFKTAASAILAELKKTYPVNHPADCLRALALTVRKNAGGTSGVLYEIFFTAGASKLEEILKQNETMSPASWFIAYSAGLAAIQKYGGAKEGSRTMLDALIPAHRAAEKLISTKSSQAPASRPSSSKLLEAAATAAQNGAEATKKISTKKAFGRSGYVGEEFGRDIPDPGAKAAAIWIAAVHKIHQSIQ